MSITKLTRSVHRKSAFAEYSIGTYLLRVYLTHNKPGTNKWSEFGLVAYMGTKRTEFTKYADFREYREMLYAAHGSDKRMNTIINSIQKMDDATLKNTKQ